jgi:hypothetical protein
MPKPPTAINAEYYTDGNLLGKITNTGGVQKQETFLTPFEKSIQGLREQYLPQTMMDLFMLLEMMAESGLAKYLNLNPQPKKLLMHKISQNNH